MKGILFLLCLLFPILVNANTLDEEIQLIFNTHFEKFKNQEYYSGATLSIYIPQTIIKNYYAGHISHSPKSPVVTKHTLFEIGSITKSFTAAILLKLGSQIKLEDNLEKWLPNYDKWSNITIRELLNMTSGLPNYSDTPLINAKIYMNKNYQFKNEELIHAAYPAKNFNPPLKKGYFYTNTGYILLSDILEKTTQKTFNKLLQTTFNAVNLKNTFYPLPTLSKSAAHRLAHGYNFNPYDNPLMVGRDLYKNNLSWAAASGGIISNSEDIIKWIKSLFTENILLDTTQKNQLQELISVKTGNPLAKTSVEDPKGFGLGIAQNFDEELRLRYWYYEGETLGFRAAYMYVPCNGIIVSTIFNSATATENDHIPLLLKEVYNTLIKENHKLSCH